MNKIQAAIIALAIAITGFGCTSSPAVKDGTSNQRTTLIVCGVLGACEIEQATENSGDIEQDEAEQDVSPDLKIIP